jgi:hypothetical protein
MFLLKGDKLLRLEQFGEDTTELVLTIEESFGIEFTTDDLAQAKTVGELSSCIVGKLRNPVSRQCLGAIEDG